jgi:hypothetical protein
MEEFSLADQTIAALSSPRKGLVNYTMPFIAKTLEVDQEKKMLPSAQHSVSTEYHSLRNSTRFIIDDDFLEFATLHSISVDADALCAGIEIARPPIPQMWIEWNESKRQETLHTKLPFNTYTEERSARPLTSGRASPERCGYVIQELGEKNRGAVGDGTLPTGFHWVFTPVFALPITKNQPERVAPIVVSPLAFILSEEGWSSADEVRRSRGADLDPFAHREREKKAVEYVVGDWWINKHKSANAAIEQLHRHLHVGQSRSIGWWLPIERGFNSEPFSKLGNLAIHFMQGDFRFLISVISTLNFDWRVQKQSVRFTGRRMRYGKHAPFNSHIELSIELPKKNGIVLRAGVLGDGIGTRRLHEVRGHWRCYRSGNRVWVRAHKRGSKELGEVTKDYRLKTGAHTSVGKEIRNGREAL